MSVPLPIIEINAVPLPQFSARSRREGPTRDYVNARNNELWQNAPPMLQSFFRPEPSMPTYDARKDKVFDDQIGIPSRNQVPNTLPAPSFDPKGSKLEGNQYFDQYAPTFDPRNVARELSAVVTEPKQDRGYLESQRLLNRGFGSRYVPEGYAEKNQFDSLQAFEALRPKIDDGIQSYRKYDD